ncbi:hypothetical protein C8Q76DRAFT_486127 [Earliella scabrosa]|nr:hypothetical protein C8Q76DRAFT_486127 [Earliella scabrosa]
MPAIGCSAPSRRGQLIGLPSDCPTTLVLPAPLQSPSRPSPDFLPPPRLPLPLIFKSSPWPSLVPPLSFLPVRPRAPTPSLRLFRRAKQSQCRPPSATSSLLSPSSRPPSLPSRRAPSPSPLSAGRLGSPLPTGKPQASPPFLSGLWFEALVHILPPPSLAPWRPYLRAPIPPTWQTLTLAPSADTVPLCILSRTTPIYRLRAGREPRTRTLIQTSDCSSPSSPARRRRPAPGCQHGQTRALARRAGERPRMAEEPFLHYTVHHPPDSDPLPLLPSLPPRARAPETGDPIALSLSRSRVLDLSNVVVSACGFRPSPCPCQSVLYDRHRRCNLAP